MNVLSFLNMKGGVGKTTSSLNTAAGLADRGKKVLLIDFDPQSNATSIFLQEEPALAVSDLIFEPERTQEAICHVGKNLDLIPATLDLASTEMKLCVQTRLPQHNRLTKILDRVEGQYDYCIIDCPPIINTLTVNVILATDILIVPIKPDRYAVSGFNITMKNVKEIQENFDCDVKLKVLFTVVNRNNTEREVINQLREAKFDCYETIIRNQPKPIATAALENRLVVKEKFCGVAQDYRDFVEEILKEE